MRRVMVTGIGIVSSAGLGYRAYTDSFRAGLRSIRRVRPSELSRSSADVAGQLDQEFVSASPRYIALGLMAAREALVTSCSEGATAGLGIVAASAVAASAEIEAAVLTGTPLLSETVRFGSLAKALRKEFSTSAFSSTIATGCVAGLDAVGIAFDKIYLGYADRILVVASEAPLTPVVFAAFDKIGALSKRNDLTSSGLAFCRYRDGFVLGEGSGALVLEAADVAQRRGVVPWAEILGWHSVSNAYHMTSMRTDGSDLVRMVSELMTRTKVDMDDVDLVDVHGTGTHINDLAESNMLLKCFSSPVDVLAQKEFVGHTLGAAGAIELAGLCSFLCEGLVPPLLGSAELDAECGFVRPRPASRNAKPNLALKIGSSFSGIHTGILIKRASDQ